MRVRTHFRLLFILSLSFLLFSCQRSNPTANHNLLIYTPHGQDLLRDFMARYKQVHA
jgi:hypothetical protein